MNINQEIQRLTQAKKDFKTKLIEKGVAVSDDELISDYPPKLDLIKTGVDTTDATATSKDILLGKTAYVNGEKVEGVVETYDGEVEGGQKARINLVKHIMDNINSKANSYNYLFHRSDYYADDFNEIDTLVFGRPESIEDIWKSEGSSANAKGNMGGDYKFLFSECNLSRLPKLVFYQSRQSGPNSTHAQSFEKAFYNLKGVKELDITILRYNNGIITYGDQNYDMFSYSDVETINFTLPSGNLGQANQSIFNYSRNLKTINVVGHDGIEGFSMYPSLGSSTTNCLMFSNCTSLTNVKFRHISCNTVYLGSGDGTNSSHYGYLLTLDSLLSAIQACIYHTSGTHKLSVGSANITKLENIYVKVVDGTDTTYYPFVQCESTDEGALTIQEYLALKNWTIS